MYEVRESPHFSNLVRAGYLKKHKKILDDINKIKKRLQQNPTNLGNCVPRLQSLPPSLNCAIYKTRMNDSSNRIGAQGGFRIYYIVCSKEFVVHLLFLYHKRETENPHLDYLLQNLKHSLDSLGL